jgi:hypothetical protein
MSGLVDLVLPKRTLTLYGVELPILGISAEAIGALWDRFPQLAGMASENFGVRELLALGTDVSAAFIAAGTGDAGNARAEAFAAQLKLGDQAELVAGILEMTLPRGPGPFVDACVRIMTSLGMLRSEQKSAGAGAGSGTSRTQSTP